MCGDVFLFCDASFVTFNDLRNDVGFLSSMDVNKVFGNLSYQLSPDLKSNVLKSCERCQNTTHTRNCTDQMYL